MRRICLLFLCVLLLLTTAFAAEPNEAQVHINVNGDGTCQVALQLTLNPEGHVDSIRIPLGDGAKDPMIEGVPVKITRADGGHFVILNREGGYGGTQHLSLTYTLEDCIRAENGWDLEVPMLAEGLAYPLDQISFRITMPGAFTQTPNFISGYLGSNVDNYMSVSIEDTVISGTVNTTLRDRESLSFRIATDPELFPRTNEAGLLFPTARTVCLVLMGLMLLYWLLRLRWRIAFRSAEQPQPPEGVGCGEICSRLMAVSADLPLMVLSWAQAGYLTIHLSQDHTVTLHKVMDMGNERSEFEGQVFRSLFAGGLMADTSEPSFRALREEVAASLPRVRGLFRRKGGRILWVRVLGALSGFAAGFGMGDLLLGPTVGRLIPILLLALACAAAAWVIQAGFVSLYCWDLQPGALALTAAGLVVVTGLLSGSLGFAALFVLGQALGGLLTVFGGQRSDFGRQSVLAILGFRRFLQSIHLKNIYRIMDQRPGYYYEMAPYALALGVDRQFAARFGTIRLPGCMWLVEDNPQGNRAPEWYPVLRLVTRIMRGQFSSRRDLRPKADVLYEEDFQQ